MRALLERLGSLKGLYRGGYRAVLAYRSDLMFGIAGMIIQVVLTVTVWRVLYLDKNQVSGVDSSTAVSYAVLAACFQSIVMPWQFSSLPLRIMQGQIGVDMIRPRSLISQCLAQATGTLVGRLPIGLSGLVVGLALRGVRPPAGELELLAWVCSTGLGIANVLTINLLVSMAAFWTLEISGPMIIYRFGSAFLSGALVPLWFMPDWLRQVVSWLPFQAQIYAPLSLWFGAGSGESIVRTLAVQGMWVVILWLLLQLVWRQAVRKVVILGG
jgi:ABC-2 type transport system permease protein